MYHPRLLIGAVLTASVFLLSMLWTSACKREPVYIGTLDPTPVDTTGNGNGTTTTHPCSPDSVYFERQILPILQSNCTMSSCHDAQSRKEGIVLDNYTNTRNTGKIKLSNPADSKLYKVLNDSDPNDRMPPAPNAALPQAQRALILKWIQQGAKNLTCDADCDTTNVTYTATVLPIIALRCQGCHTNTNASGGIALANYSQIKATVSNGKLWGSINHAAGYKPMPYPAGNSKMPFCDLRKVKIWIDQGAPNN